jgi:hypothetical protein
VTGPPYRSPQEMLAGLAEHGPGVLGDAHTWAQRYKTDVMALLDLVGTMQGTLVGPDDPPAMWGIATRALRQLRAALQTMEIESLGGGSPTLYDMYAQLVVSADTSVRFHYDAALQAQMMKTPKMRVQTTGPVTTDAAEYAQAVREWTAKGSPMDEIPVLDVLNAPRPDWHCPKCGSTHWVAASLDEGRTRIRQCVPCGHYSDDPAPERVAGPAEDGTDDQRG